MTDRYFLFGFFASLLFVGCKQSIEENKSLTENPVVQKLEGDWLLGKWKFEDEGGILYEKWSKKNDTVYIGESYFIEKNDTVFFENLRLTKNQDSLFYESLDENLIHPKLKTFSGKYSFGDKLEVENKQQAFPRKIKYILLNDTLMIIEISGVIDGSEEVQPYEMIRIDDANKQ